MEERIRFSSGRIRVKWREELSLVEVEQGLKEGRIRFSGGKN